MAKDAYGPSRRNLKAILDETPVQLLDDSSRIVFFSDLHMGNGGRNDDFAPNSGMFEEVLTRYYLGRDYTLVLNGDIEELQRFRLHDIRQRWSSTYRCFNSFGSRDRLIRLIGNHDMDLLRLRNHDFDPLQGIRYDYAGNTVFVFHGHQTAAWFTRHNGFVGFILRYLANPLGISNFSVAHDSVKRFRTEQRAYQFASENQLIAIMGHTHRPLFESMSKVDTVKFEIERLCRKYPGSSAKKKRSIEATISDHKKELTRIRQEDDERATVASLYNAHFLIPCTFNSGTVIGKRGMTCLEIHDGRLALVHWFDENRRRKYLHYANLETELLPGTSIHRVTLKSESLDYIFTRIKLLADS